MRYYPINIDTLDRKVLIAGGGKVAERKLKTLLDTEFIFDIVSKSFTQTILDLKEEFNDRIDLIKMNIDESISVDEYDYIIIATDDLKANELLEEKAKSANIMYVNSAVKSDSSFLMNKVIEKSNIIVSISTSGKSPTLTKIVAAEIEALLDKLDTKKIEKLFLLRAQLVKKESKNISKIIQKLYYKDIEYIDRYLEELNEDNNRI
ncbi:MAG: bifunctional precorrin-2 dehydrogenase/sirohydrochlorin ferrochelatase [Tissierellia bacterium]|nr:bifunctional precorrin-2 dehydrogenase/sirohydrochlorin ferrochelatase [Tissierellia bacterium]